MADNNKLSTVIDSYTFFEPDQVLTPDQLNSLTGYLDRQERLTRVKTRGTGIVTGLHVRAADDGTSVTVSKGSAITTDGDMLFLDADTAFTHFREYVDKNGQYEVFAKDGKQIPLYELAVTGTADEALPRFEKATGNTMVDMAVLLYMENFRLSQNICTGGDCDNKGQLEKHNLKVLLARKSDLAKLPAPAYFDTKDPVFERVLLDPSATDHYGDLLKAYREGIQAMTKALTGLLPETYSVCEGLLKGVYGDNPTKLWREKLKETADKAAGVTSGIQYVHDFFLDVMGAYEEFREALFRRAIIDWTKIIPFPKHVMAGSPVVEAELRHDPYRHGFYTPDTATLDSEGVAEVRFLHKRLDLMIKSFDLTPALSGRIRVMPRRDKSREAALRPVPSYYKDGGDETVNTYWDFGARMRGREPSIFSISSDTRGFGKDKLLGEPWDFRASHAPFYWIDGHMDKDVDEAEKQLNDIIAWSDLPFQVRTLQIENDITLLPLKPKRPVFTRDLKSLFTVQKNALKIHLDDLQDFNTALAGTITTAVKDSKLPARDPLDAKSSFELFTSKDTDRLGQKVTVLKEKLEVPIDDFDHEGFEKEFNETIGIAANLNKGVKGVTYNSTFTPYETVINSTAFKQLTLVKDILIKRKEKMKHLTLFGSFIKDHPGMTHQGGVPSGGTFVLVYSGATKKVVADFALPYRFEDDREEDEEETVGVVTKPKWTDLNDLNIHFNKDQYFEDKIAALDQNLKTKIDVLNENIRQKTIDLQEKINANTASIGKVYTDSMTALVNGVDTVIKAKETVTGAAKEKAASAFAKDDYAGAATVIEAAKDYRTAYEKKVDEGTATEEDKEMMDTLDKAAAKAITGTVKKIASRETDVEAGSEEAKFIEYARTSMGTIKDETLRKGITSEVARIVETSSTKTNLVNRLKTFG
ncbi:MAG: hypothetical protein A4E57_00950 [Syntrophorhabdaceae bacterium PtaU1.Bin034]|nr:MAG: hypothetical protein A4E57_00950 [Syntrophorhabdaceae bacterium PtaU1.Bin034]